MEFYNAILNSDIDFLEVIKIKYHFLLADKWIFTVENFIREELNSGWLINHIRESFFGRNGKLQGQIIKTSVQNLI